MGMDNQELIRNNGKLKGSETGSEERESAPTDKTPTAMSQQRTANSEQRTANGRPPEEATLDVGEFDSHGTSRSELNGRTVEVEHGIPGERVTALVFGRRRRWGRIVDVLEPAPDRVEAICPHFHEGCGGCQWQMLSYRSQVARKVAQVESEIVSGGLAAAIGAVHTMDDPWRYRSTAGLALGHRVGFRRRGTQSIVGLQDCPISHPLIGRVAAYLNRAIESEELPNYRGDVALEVRVVDGCDAERGLHAAITPTPGSRHASIEAVLPLARLLAKFEPTVGIMYRHKQELPQLLFGKPFGRATVRGKPFAVSGATFFQTNLVLLPRLLDSFLGAAAPHETDVVVDVYGGVGLFGLLLAPAVKRVIEIEIDQVGIEGAQISAREQGIANVEYRAGTAESILDQLAQADTVIVDPPRSGLTPKVIAAIGRLLPRRILYVSCFAHTLVRDILSFQDFGYRSDAIEVFDFYPQTRHVELFTVLER
jgi:23S rRNA (uracil1939-C5)-methyltransferase